MSKRLFIVANRLPVCIEGEENEPRIKSASGGLVSAVNSYLQGAEVPFSEVFWAGVPECAPSVWKEASRHLQQDAFTYLPVMVHKEQYHQYYNGFSNAVLWPLFHYFPSFAEYNSDDYNQYRCVNEQFADVLSKHCLPGDTVWIHDYHLMPLAGLLRTRIPELTIGFFLHIPFPSYEVLRLLPRGWQRELLQGMLGADLVGFHTMDYAGHFLESVRMVLGIEADRHVVRFRERLVKVDVFPISIDYQKFNSAASSPLVQAKRDDLKQKLVGKKLIFSVDRLDYTKGVHNRLKSYELFLKQNPEYRGKVVFVIVVVPSRDTIRRYAERKKMIDESISRINSEIGNIHWQPVVYQYQSLEFNDMIALYTACDLALITPLRDGMNLVSKEFVASRQDGRGVLVLSEMAGASRELHDALLINPNDINEMAAQIKAGLEMKEGEQEQRIRRMQGRIAHYDVTAWAEDFMTGLRTIKNQQQNFQAIFLDEYARRRLFDDYRSAQKRLLLLDYDGTLVSYAPSPEEAVPGNSLLELLKTLGAAPNTDVYIISGRSSQWLEKHFASLPLHLIAEHGARVRPRAGSWQTEVLTHSEWKEEVDTLMEMYVRRCPYSTIEEKEFSMVWHWRNCNPEQGKLRAQELAEELQELLPQRRLEVIIGEKIVEVRNRGINKGTAIKKVLQRAPYDFIFAVGDDRTDEDMFKTLASKPQCFTIKVGPHASYAQYNLLTPQMVISLLQHMSHLVVNRESSIVRG